MTHRSRGAAVSGGHGDARAGAAAYPGSPVRRCRPSVPSFGAVRRCRPSVPSVDAGRNIRIDRMYLVAGRIFPDYLDRVGDSGHARRFPVVGSFRGDSVSIDFPGGDPARAIVGRSRMNRSSPLAHSGGAPKIVRRALFGLSGLAFRTRLLTPQLRYVSRLPRSDGASWRRG
jgi:hypothetical protein